VLNPSPDTVISSGDRIRVFGLRQQIENLTPAASLKRTAT
jgi:K+/H+ antiporter YhaU regulatory subunit KhtT